MKKLILPVSLFLFAIMIFSCAPKQKAPVVNTDPAALYAEVDKAAPVNTLSENESCFYYINYKVF